MKKIFFVILLMAMCVNTAHAVLWNKVVARYNDQILTLWDVEREIQIERVRKGVSFTKEISLDEFKEFTKKLVIDLLIFQEAQGFQVGALSKDQVAKNQKEKILSSFKNHFINKLRYEEFLGQYHLTENELEKILMRSVVVEAFIKEKIYTMNLNQEKLQIKKQRLEESLQDWIKRLKERNQIKILFE